MSQLLEFWNMSFLVEIKFSAKDIVFEFNQVQARLGKGLSLRLGAKLLQYFSCCCAE